MSKFQCLRCNKEFSRKENLKHHLSKKFPCISISHQMEHVIKTYDCGTCHKKYSKNQSLLKHMKKIHNLIPTEKITKHKCSQCKHYYSSNSNLKRHQVMCTTT